MRILTRLIRTFATNVGQGTVAPAQAITVDPLKNVTGECLRYKSLNFQN